MSMILLKNNLYLLFLVLIFSCGERTPLLEESKEGREKLAQLIAEADRTDSISVIDLATVIEEDFDTVYIFTGYKYLSSIEEETKLNTRQMKWFKTQIEDGYSLTIDDTYDLIIYSKDNLVIEYFTFDKANFDSDKERFEKGNTLFKLNRKRASNSNYFISLTHVPR